MYVGRFLEGLLEHWVAEAFVIVGGLLFAFLRKYRESWAPIVGYGLGGATCVAVIIFTFTGHALFSPPLTDEENVEAKVTGWIQYFGYGMQRIPPPSPDDDFAYLITPPSGSVPVAVLRDKKSRPGYLQLVANLQVSPEHRAILQKITPAEAYSVVEATEADVLRQSLAFALSGDPNHIQNMAIVKSLVIDGLTQSTFGEGLDNVESTVALTRNDFLLALRPYEPVATPKVK
jgi:hypothetical protein